MYTTIISVLTTHAVRKKHQVDRGRDSPFVVIDHSVSLKSPQLLRVLLYPLKSIAKRYLHLLNAMSFLEMFEVILLSDISKTTFLL